MVLFVLGFTLPEMRDLARWIVLRLIQAYALPSNSVLRLERSRGAIDRSRCAKIARSVAEYAAEQLQYEAEYSLNRNPIERFVPNPA